MSDWSQIVVGNDVLTPMGGSKLTRYINFDNAASTPAFKQSAAEVFEALKCYGSIHRGEGYKSRFTTEEYENCRHKVAEFIGLDTNNNAVIFVKNSTEAINKLADAITFSDEDIIISTFMEHHSNDLPWRNKAKIKYVKVLSDGTLDYEDLFGMFKKYGRKVRLLTVTGASNVTGAINDIGFLAELAHKHGAEILVDAAQLIPHRNINMLPDRHPRHIDYLVFSGHKMYAPFGIGVLAGKKSIFSGKAPRQVGGGTVKIVQHQHVYWEDLPAREEAGTPNVLGAIALRGAIRQIENLGMDQIEELERNLCSYLLNRLDTIPGVKLYGPQSLDKRVGVFSFAANGIDHETVACRLSDEANIAVRSGCFCAHPYILSLLDISPKETKRVVAGILKGNKHGLPGLVRVSLGLYNTTDEIDTFILALKNISKDSSKNNHHHKTRL